MKTPLAIYTLCALLIAIPLYRGTAHADQNASMSQNILMSAPVALQGTTYTSATASIGKSAFFSVGWTVTGTTIGGTLQYQVSIDGATWLNTTAIVTLSGSGSGIKSIFPVPAPFLRVQYVTGAGDSSNQRITIRLIQQ